MKKIAFGCAGLLALLPTIALGASTLLGNSIVTPERVIYDQPQLAPGFLGLTIAKPYRDQAIAEAKADCSSRGGILNTCSAVCGLNGCFSTCSLACEMPKVIDARAKSTVRNYLRLTEKFDDVSKDSKGEPKTAEGQTLKRQLQSATEPYERLLKAQADERRLLQNAVAKWRAYVPKSEAERALVAKRLNEVAATQNRIFKNVFSTRCDTAVKRNLLRSKHRAADTEVLVVNCNDDGSELLVQFGESGAKTFSIIEVYADTKWQKVEVGGANGKWIDGNTSAIIHADGDAIEAIAAYQCTLTNGKWKCGCTDAACRSQKWQVVGIVQD